MSDSITLIIEEEPIQVIETAQQGPPGPPGPQGPAGATVLTCIAAIALGGHRAVVADANGFATYADSSSLDHAGIVMGITTGAAEANTQVGIQNIGEMIEPSWEWIPERTIFLGTDGTLTQTPPTTGFLQALGFAVAQTKMIVQIGQPILLV